MSTHRYIDRICLAGALLSLLLTLLFVNGQALGLQPASAARGYEARLFDTTSVHTIDIVMDQWEEFLETCEDEEYAACAAVIDGEAYKNVGLRAKGNTSLSSVSAMGSDRYSFKLEFDHYDSGKTYYGLDKLCLNNLIQDNTMMKDYLTCRMMGEFGVAAPLCSFVFLTVNGEDWGLYLAVEGLEESFLQRNYGSGYGDLYKPDSMSFGGGRGNGRDFDMEDFDFGAFDPEQFPSGQGGGPGRGAAAEPAAPGGQSDVPVMPDAGGAGSASGEPHRMDGGGPGGGMGSADVKLQYAGDDPDSYANIFSSAKTEVTEADQARLIQALKALGEGDAEAALDVDAVLRYLVVHNFVVNGDSYTGSMVHNYYLYEEDGKLSMLPWDYNLAFGTFQGGSASAAVNDPIDTPLSVAGDGDRPMADWISGDGAYTELYHRYFAEFLEAVDPAAIIDEAAALIAPYVERDPTKFCTAAEFETGVEALRTFCRLRAESVSGQLAGTVPSTDDGQSADSASLVDASGLTLSDMGTMNMGGGRGGPGGRERPQGVPGSSGEGGGRPDRGLQAENRPEGSPSGRPDAMELGMPVMPGGNGPQAGAPQDGQALLLLGVSVLVLLVGILWAWRYRRRKTPPKRPVQAQENSACCRR